jgi:hypothetical protein
LEKARALAMSRIKEAQASQKRNYDVRCNNRFFRKGEVVYVHVPQSKKGQTPKLARPWKGPFRVDHISPDGLNLVLLPITNPHKAKPMRVHINRVKVGYLADQQPEQAPTGQAASETEWDTQEGDLQEPMSGYPESE